MLETLLENTKPKGKRKGLGQVQVFMIFGGTFGSSIVTSYFFFLYIQDIIWTCNKIKKKGFKLY